MIGFSSISWQGLNYLFFVVPATILIAIIIFYWKDKYTKKLSLLCSSKWRSLLVPYFSMTFLRIKFLFYFLGFLFLFLAFLQPQWDEKKEKVEQRGRDLFIALDISRSMLAEDANPNRVQMAKQKILRLVKNLSCERVGLILFSGEAFVQCPLTSDYGAFYLFLNNVDAETISPGTTALDSAIKKALHSFSMIPERKNKILVLFTDGEDFSANLSGVKQQAMKEKLMLFAIGLGSEDGAPVPVIDNKGNKIGHQKDQDANVVISKLNEPMLRALAFETGGMYIAATSDDKDVITIIERINKIEKEVFEDKNIVKKQERYNYFTLTSLICFLIQWLL